MESPAAWHWPLRRTRTKHGSPAPWTGSATAGQTTMACTPTRMSRSASGGCRSWTCRWPGTSRCARPTAASGCSSTGRSTTTSRWRPNCGNRESPCGPTATPRCCSRPTPWWARTWCTGFAVCTRSPSGTPGPANCSAPGTRSASSPSTTASTAGRARSPVAGPTALAAALPAARPPRALCPARAAAGMRRRRGPASRPRRSRLTLRRPRMTGSPPPRGRPGGQAGMRPESLMGLA